jgi:type VI secretion system Hcp family effector
MRGRGIAGRLRLGRIGQLVAVALVAGAATAVAQLSDNFTNPPAPVPGHGTTTYLTMTGSHGPFTGGVTAKGHAGAIAVLGLDGGITDTLSSTGQPVGRAACDGVNFRKPTDRATPLLIAAAGDGETITTATFNEYQPAGAGTETLALQINLTDSIITSMHHVDSTTTGAYDDVTLVPAKVTYTWKPTGTVATYTCASAG